jgi:DNA-binding transcriptional LysR family regulator
METKWLEDFVSLAETRSFSRSAQLRHVTQPAFSRRIQSLEAWAGTDLVDRSSYPTRLTPAGQTLYEQSLDILHTLQSARAMLRAHTSAAQDVIEFAVPHTLAFTFFPSWLSGLRDTVGVVKTRLTALNVHDAVMRLVEGSSDLLIAYHHAAQPIQLDTERYEMLPLGQEVLSPYCKPGDDGAPLFPLPGLVAHPLPYLAYAPGAYLGRAVEQLLKDSAHPVHLDRRYETDMAEGLKAMAIEGHGVAFLPASAVRRELRSKRLVAAGELWQTTLDIRIYRERATSRKAKRAVEAFWADLQGHLKAGLAQSGA